MLSVILVYAIALSVVALGEWLTETNVLGFCDSKLITQVKSLIVQAQNI
jgi:hypothetical protein